MVRPTQKDNSELINKFLNMPLSDEELRKIGEKESNPIIRLAHQIFGKINFVKEKIDSYFLERGLSVIKKDNLAFLEFREPRSIQNIPLFSRLKLDKNTQGWNNFYKLKNEADKPGNQWMKALIDLNIANQVDDTKMEALGRLQTIYKENKDLPPPEEFVELFKYDAVNYLSETKINLLADTLQMSVAASPDYKKFLADTLFSMGDQLPKTVKFYQEHPFLLKHLATLLSSNSSQTELTEQLSKIQATFTNQLKEFKKSNNEGAYIAYCKEKNSFGTSLDKAAESLDQNVPCFNLTQLSDYISTLEKRFGNSFTGTVIQRFQDQVKQGNLNHKLLPEHKIIEENMERVYMHAQAVGKETALRPLIEDFQKILSDNPRTSFPDLWNRVKSKWANAEGEFLKGRALKDKMDGQTIASKSVPDVVKHLNSKFPLFDEGFVTEYLSSGTPEELLNRNARLLLLKEWGDFLVGIDPDRSPERAQAFIQKLGVVYFDAAPWIASERSEDIQTLYSFYLSALDRKAEHLEPMPLANALQAFLKPDRFHEGVKSLGSYLSHITNSKAEDALLDLYKVQIKALPQAPVTKVETQLPPQTLASVIKNDPASLAVSILPPFAQKLGLDLAAATQMRESLKSVSPLINQLLLTDAFKAQVNDLETIIDMAFPLIKNALSGSSEQGKQNLIESIKKLLIQTFSASKKTGVNKVIADTIISANAQFIARNKLSEAEQINFNKELGPIQKWLLDGLPSLARKSPFMNTLASIGISALGTRAVQWAASSPIVINLLIDQLPLPEDQLKALKNNKDLRDNLGKLIEVILPLIPKIKANHDLAFYSEAVNALNEMIHQLEPVNEEAVYNKVSEIVQHFVEKDFAKYEEPILAALAQVPSLA